MQNIRYQIRKSTTGSEIFTVVSNELGEVIELDFNEASTMCRLMNKSALNKERYELLVIHDSIKPIKIEVEQIGIPEDPQFDVKVVSDEVFTKEDVGKAYLKGFEDGCKQMGLTKLTL